MQIKFIIYIYVVLYVIFLDTKVFSNGRSLFDSWYNLVIEFLSELFYP